MLKYEYEQKIFDFFFFFFFGHFQTEPEGIVTLFNLRSIYQSISDKRRTAPRKSPKK